jgi:hypothetical protein
MTKDLKEMEYPDAPSGYVTMYHYKEPFMPFEYHGKGFGYQGVLLFDGSSDKIQCHLCGEWFGALGHHLHREHNIKASEYKDLVGLRQTSALVSESLRAKMIANGLDKRLQNLRAGGKKSEETKKKISETMKKKTRETENELGTCPAQLLERIQRKAKELGRCPTSKECGFVETVRKVYGTFNNACKIAGLEPLESGKTLKSTKYTKDYFIPIVREYWIKKGKLPRQVDLPLNKVGKAKYAKFKNQVQKEVLFGEKIYHNTPVKINYSKSELIEILNIFVQSNNRMPSISDCKRGLLPHASRYYYHFGNFKNALKEIEI